MPNEGRGPGGDDDSSGLVQAAGDAARAMAPDDVGSVASWRIWSPRALVMRQGMQLVQLVRSRSKPLVDVLEQMTAVREKKMG